MSLTAFSPQDLNSDTMTFLGGSANSQASYAALPYESFVVSNGDNALINHFSISGGDKLDLTPLLSGVSPGLLEGNLQNYVKLSVLPGAPGNFTTDLTITGPGGNASVALESSSQISTLSQLVPALTLPTH